MSLRRRVAIGVLAAASGLSAPDALACDCPMEPPVEIALEKASAVVHARVAKVSDYETWHDGGAVGTTGRRTIHLAVVRAWRGEIAPNTTFDLVAEGDDCEHDFQKPGEEHVLYLHKRDGGWRVVTCGRSVQMGVGTRRNGESEVALLDKVVAKNAARWGGSPAASATPSTAAAAPAFATPKAAPSAASTPPAPPKTGGCAGCASAPVAPAAPSVLVALTAIAALVARRMYLSRQRLR